MNKQTARKHDRQWQGASAAQAQDPQLARTAADAAIRTLGATEAGQGTQAECRLHISDGKQGLLADLQQRCLQFGIRAVEEELVLAGLLLLSQLTETALEVAVIQSLRADRSSTPRSRHRS